MKVRDGVRVEVEAGKTAPRHMYLSGTGVKGELYLHMLVIRNKGTERYNDQTNMLL